MVSKELEDKIKSGEVTGENDTEELEADEELTESFAPFSECIVRGAMSHTQTFPDMKEVSRPISKACRAIMKIARRDNKIPTECIDKGCKATGVEVSDLMEELDKLNKELIDKILHQPPMQEFLICGYEAIERTATPVSAKSNTNRVYVPKSWNRVMVVKLD